MKKNNEAKSDEPGNMDVVLSVSLDRIESGVAVLTVNDGDEIIHLPARYMPAQTQEGDHLRINISPDAETTQAVRRRMTALQTELSTELPPDRIEL
ncbi:MAG: DUF3006 domain-containing protein [Blastocatellia bacterium]